MMLINTSLWAGLLILLIIIVRAIAVHRLPKSSFVAMWFVALLRLIMPANFGLLNVFFAYTSTNKTVMTGVAIAAESAVVAPSQPWIFSMIDRGRSAIYSATAWCSEWMPLLTLVWLAGAVLLSVYFLIAFIRCRRRLNMAIPIPGFTLRAQGRRRPVRVYVSDRIRSPLTYGVLRPRIVLPKGMGLAMDDELRYVLKHELTHITRFDIVTKTLLLMVACLHWFNPLVWVMYLLACRDIELSCDERVLKSSERDGRKAYAMTLIQMEETRAVSMPFCAAFGKTAIEERVVSIMKYKKSRLSGAISFALVALFSLSVLAAGEEVLSEVETIEVAQTVTVNLLMPEDVSMGQGLFAKASKRDSSVSAAILQVAPVYAADETAYVAISAAQKAAPTLEEVNRAAEFPGTQNEAVSVYTFGEYASTQSYDVQLVADGEARFFVTPISAVYALSSTESAAPEIGEAEITEYAVTESVE